MIYTKQLNHLEYNLRTNESFRIEVKQNTIALKIDGILVKENKV